MTRWFNGMSTYYLNLDKPFQNSTAMAGYTGKGDGRQTFDRNYDLEYENSYNNRREYRALDKF